ncbi:hypothetical protein EIP86_007770 [Pleurotus ostreatoroseus]|nr:hypothetical protein EIP86_007770 [Pleurotus ostreatoroseus]
MTETASERLAFQALLLANEQRNAYGLRYNDYERYRKHCANRTHRLRSSLKLTHGKGREFKKLPPVKLEEIKDAYLELLLFEAERAWTYSRELSQLATLPANADKAGVLRKNATSRFRRAVNWATELLSHCQALYAAGRLPASSLVQATVYTLILNGRFLRHRYGFDDALAQLSVARALLDAIAQHAGTSREQALATAFADEIGPEIRHCAHELGNAKAYDVDGIAAEAAAQHKNALVEGYDALVQALAKESAGGASSERKKLKPLLWEDEPVPVRNPELVDVFLRIQEAEQKLKDSESAKLSPSVGDGDQKKERVSKGTKSKRGVAAYDAILLALSEAEDPDMHADNYVLFQLSAGSSSGPSGRDLVFVHAYITYQLLARRIQRDLLLISTILNQSQGSMHHAAADIAGPSHAKPKAKIDVRLYPAIVKLLDTVIQSLTQMRTLAIVDDSPDLATAVDARIAFTKARRCQYLARSYTYVKKYAEALTLLQRASLHLREARSSLSLLPSLSTDPINTLDPSFYGLSEDLLTSLDEEVAAESLQCKKDWFNYNGGDATGTVDRQTYKKLLFFDIALNYVELDMDKLQERAGKTVAATSAKVVAPVPQRAQPGVVQPEIKSIVSRAKVEEIDRPMTPEPTAPAKGGLGSLLGGWWGRK